MSDGSTPADQSPADSLAEQSPADESPVGPALGLTSLANAIRILLLVAAVLSAALAYLAARMRAALDDVAAGRSDTGPAQDAVDAFFGGARVFFLALVTVGGLFVVWLWRAARNNRQFGRPGALGPGWAVGAWFIPVGSLVIPGLQVQQVWKGADSSLAPGDPAWRQRPSSPQIWLWWAAYVAGQVLTFVGFSLMSQDDDAQSPLRVTELVDRIDDVRLGVTLFVAAQVLLVLAAALGAAMVVSLSRRQETAAAVLGADTTGWDGAIRRSVSPPAWHPDPTGRCDLRYWDGHLWTEHVTRNGDQGTDPV